MCPPHDAVCRARSCSSVAQRAAPRQCNTVGGGGGGGGGGGVRPTLGCRHPACPRWSRRYQPLRYGTVSSGPTPRTGHCPATPSHTRHTGTCRRSVSPFTPSPLADSTGSVTARRRPLLICSELALEHTSLGSCSHTTSAVFPLTCRIPAPFPAPLPPHSRPVSSDGTSHFHHPLQGSGWQLSF